jgi:hypothetical protein
VPFWAEAAVTDDLLEALLRRAMGEKALDPESLPAFARALRERAEQILAERLRPLEERAAAFEKESRWRAERLAGVEKDREFQAAENENRRRRITELEGEVAEVARMEGETRAAHDRLLAHHRSALRRLADDLDAMAASAGALGPRLREVAEGLRRDIR